MMEKNKRKLTQKRLRKFVFYNKETGKFFRLNGKAAGCLDIDSGYIKIWVDGASYYAHRLAFLYMEGSMPAEETDHLNGDESDNRWANLKRSTVEKNKKNMRMYSNNTSGVNGVYWKEDRNKWCAEGKHGGKKIFLGLFETIEEAKKVRVRFNKKYGFTERHGCAEAN